MTLDSISRVPLFMTCRADSHWSRSEPELNLFLSAQTTQSPSNVGFVSRTSRKYASTKSRKLSYASRPVRGWETVNGNFDRETKKRNNFPMESCIFLPTEHAHDDHSMTSRTAKDYQLPWAPVSYQDNDCLKTIRLKSQMMDVNGADFECASLASSIRERTQSTGSWKSFGMSHVSSASSLSSGRFSMTDDSFSGRISGNDDLISDQKPASDVLLETTRRNLVNLWASRGDETHGPWTPDIRAEFTRSSSFSGGSSSMNSYGGVSRKNSDLEPNTLLMRQVRQRYDDLPVDVTCRKRQAKAMIERSPAETANDLYDRDNRVRVMGRRTDDYGEHSILRSMLMERGRSYSMSVIEKRRRRLAANPSDHPSTAVSSISATLNQFTGTPSDKQVVTFAKKNLLPVTARITDLLGRMVDFAKSIPEFQRLCRADQETLLVSSCLRLLLLAMAEANLQFATTVVSADGAAVSSGGEEGHHQVEPGSSGQCGVPKAPTTHFVCAVQNFIRKCQLLDVTSEEYHHMKTIALFQSGIGSMECTMAATRINSSSRQQLQDLVSRCHPSEKLRYSSLLLSLHTLYGIHSGMMRSLFCRHLDKGGGILALIRGSLSAS